MAKLRVHNANNHTRIILSSPPSMGVPSNKGADEPALLLILDGLVRRDGAATGLRHEICVGVERAGLYRWWHVRPGRRFTCGFLDDISSTAHVTMCLSEADADRVLRSEPIEGDFYIHGERDILRRFLERYTSKTSVLDARISAVRGHRSRAARDHRS